MVDVTATLPRIAAAEQPPPQVTIDDAQLGGIALQDLGRPTCTVLVTESMKTVTTYAPLGIPGIGQGKNMHSRRKVREEGRIEDRHLSSMRQHDFGGRDGGQSGHIMQRSQLAPTADALFHRFVDQHALRELGAAMNNPVSHDLDVRQGLSTLGMRFRHRLNRATDGRLIFRHVDRAALRRFLRGGA